MKCNRDCFNCPFDDCISDQITLAEYKEQNSRDMDARDKPKQATNDRKEYFRQYYRRNKAKMDAQSQKYFQEHKQEIYLRERIKRRQRNECV